MKGRENRGAPPTDLLVCFPSRAHLTLMPKPICSPARPTEPNSSKRHHRPLLWAKTKPIGSEIDDEPTSPKVTCAGQIKVRPKANCKNWQSVMQEIELLHNKKNNKHKKRPSWAESLGFKKDIMQFLTCLRGLRFDLRCFGSLNGAVVTSDDEEIEEEEEIEEVDEDRMSMEVTDGTGSSRTVFSKWFMVLQENQDHGFVKENQEKEEEMEEEKQGFVQSGAPPPNALLLMRCRSAPAKSWLEEKEEELETEEKQRKAELVVMEEEKKKTESLILKCYAPDFFKVSSDIAKETWVVGGTRDPLSRSRSWKR